jgi:hypothetical protein
MLLKGGPVELRYLGFDQKLNTRTYRFKGVAGRDPALYFLISADLRLFLLHRIGIQEGPTLCANKLARDLQVAAAGDHELTDEDLCAFADARTLADAQKAQSRRNGARQH